MQQLDSLIQNPTDDLGKIIDTLRKLHHELLGSERQEKEEHMIKLFSKASKENDLDQKWSRIRFYIYSHIIVLQPSSKIIPQISLLTKHGTLFKTLTILYLFCRKTNEGNEVFKQAFIRSLNEYLKQQSGFYSRNALNYTQNLPKLLLASVPNECLQIFIFFFSFLQQASLSDSAMSLFRDVFGIIKQMKANLTQNLIRTILEIFKAGNNYPYQALYYCFDPWYLFYYKKMIPQTEIQEQLDRLSNMVEQSLKNSESEFLHFFQWDFCFKLFKEMPIEKPRIKFLFLLFISLKIRSYQLLDQSIIIKLEELSKNFIFLLREYYSKKKLNSLFPTFTSQLIATFKIYTQSLKQIKCIFPPSPFISRSQTKQIFTFSDLYSFKKPLDQINSQIIILIEIYHSNDRDDIKKWYDIFDKIYRCSIVGSIFYSELTHSYFDMIQSDMNISIFYLTELIKTWIDFTTELTYRATHLQRFTMNERESYGITERCIQYERKLADVSNIQSKIIRDIPSCCYQTCSNTIISILSKNVKKHVISPFFILSFEKFISSSPDFRRFLIQRMHQYFFENLSLLTSSEKDDVIFLEQWLLMMIKLNKPNDPFLVTLMHDSQFQTISTISSTGKQIIHQYEAVNIMIIYTQFVIENIKLNSENQLNLHKSRRIQLDDLHPSVRIAASTVFINENLFDISKFYLGIMQLLMFALKSNDSKTRSKAIHLISKFSESDGIIDQFPELIHTFFSALKTESNEENAKLMFKEIPKFSHDFTAYSNLRHFSDLHSFGKNKIPTFEFLCAIEQHMDFSSFEFFNLYHLLSHIFHSTSFECISNECFSKYLSFLGTLHQCEPIQSKVDHLFSEIRDYYLEKDPTYYFLCLVSISNISRSSCSNYIIEKVHEFVSMAPIESLKTAADRLFTFVPFTNNFFLLVVGLSALIKKSSELVNFTHIQPIIKSSDSKIYFYYNSFLKLYLSNISKERIAEFVNYSYCNLSDVLPLFRPLLIKRMRKTRILIELDKIEFSNDTDFLICYQTAACILCGNLKAIPNSNDFFKLIFQSFRINEENQKNYTFWVRGLILIYSIFKYKYIPFLSNQEFLKLFYNFVLGYVKTTIFKSILPHNYNLAKKTINLVFEYGKIDKKLQVQLEQVLAWPEQENNCSSILAPKKIMSLHCYRIISKILPNKVSKNAYNIFLESIKTYSDLNEYQQIQAILSFKFILKILIKIQDKTILIPHLTSILNSFGKLFQSQEFPFRYIIGKYFKRIISMVQNETVSILTSINRDIKNADLILDSLAEDLNIQKQILIEISHSNDILKLHPQAFLLMSKILKNNSNYGNFINLHSLVNNVLRMYDEGIKSLNDDLIIDNFVINSIIESLFNETLKIPSFKTVQLCAQIFSYPEFLKSKLYYKFKKLMRKLPNEFVTNFLNFILSIDKTDPFIHGLLLKLSIKSLLPINDLSMNEILWNFLISKLTDSDIEYLLSIFNCLYILVKNNNIVKMLLNDLIKNLFTALSNQNNQLNLIALKLSYKLIEKKLLPIEIHQSIIVHLLTFPKFFDNVYHPYSSFIISTVKKPYSYKLNDALTLFITDNLISYKDTSKIIFIIQYFPNIESNLPFEILPTLIEILQTLLQQNTVASQIEFYFMYILKTIAFLNTSADSMTRFLNLCYNFLYKVLKKNEGVKKFPTQFFQFALQKDELETPFPDHLLKEIDSFPASTFMFGLISFILKFAPTRTVLAYFDSIKKKLDINNELVFYYSKYFIPASFKTPELTEKFLPFVESLVEVLKANQESLILNTISSAPSNIRYPLIKKFYSKSWIKPEMCLTLLEKLDYSHQEIFIGELFEGQNVLSLCHHIYQVIKSNEVENSVKIFILNQLVKREEINDIQVTMKIINLLYNRISSKELLIPNSHVHIIRLSVSISYLVDQKSRLLLFDYCSKLLESIKQPSLIVDEGEGELFRFISLLDILKVKLWNDKCLPFIILLINGEKNQPLIAFSNRLSDCSQVARFTFERLLRNEKCPNLRAFYLKSLKKRNKQVIKDLTIAFQNNKIRLPDELNWKASKYSILCDFDWSTYSNPHILYPNTFSDYRLGSILPMINKNEMILTINFLLTNYVDDFCNFSSFSSEFDENSENGFSLPLIESIFDQSCGLFKTINENTIDYSYFFKHDKFNCIQKVNLIELMAMNSFQIQSNLNRFKLERIVTIEAIVQLQNNGGSSLKLNGLSHNVNSYFASIIKNCSNKINGKIDKQECQVNVNNSYQYFILSPIFLTLFKRISGYTKHGFIVATLSDIDFSLSSFHLLNSNSSSSVQAVQQAGLNPIPSVQSIPFPMNANNSYESIGMKVNINQSSATALNKYKWASFIFNMFFNTPSAILANSTLTNFFACIDDPYLNKLHRFELATRSVTVLRICSSIEKLHIVVTDSAKKMSKNVTNCMRIWTSQLLHVAKNETFRHTKKAIFYDLLSLFTRYSIDPPEALQREIMQFDLNARRSFSVLIEFRNFLNYLFENSETDFDNNNDQVLRINSILPMNLPSQNYRMNANSILRIHGDSIHRISENLIVFSAATYSLPTMQLIAERVDRPNESVSFSSGLYLLNMALKNSYASSSRRVNFTSHFSFEIGHEYVIYDAPSGLKLITDFDSFVCRQPESNEIFELDNQGQFSPLCSLYSSSPFPESFFARRQSFVRSLTCTQFLRCLFCLRQTEHYMYSTETFKVPVNIGEFHVPPIDESLADQFTFQIPVKAKFTSRLTSTENEDDDDSSQRLKNILGPSLEGEVMMTVAAVSKSLAENIECLRGILEILAFDGIQRPNTESIRNIADGFQDRLLDFTPPDPAHALYPDYHQWIDNLLCFVGKEERKQRRNLADEDKMNNPMFEFNHSHSSFAHPIIDSNSNAQLSSFGSNMTNNDTISGNIDYNQFNDPYLDNDSVLNDNQNKYDDFNSSISQDRTFDDDNPFF